MNIATELLDRRLNTASVGGLDSYLSELRKCRYPFKQSLDIAIDYVISAGGKIEYKEDENIHLLELHGVVAYCFQPYPDIDQFYFET